MLDATSPLNGYVREFDGVSLAEVTGHALVSIATPLGGEKALNTALKSAFGVEAPAGGQSVLGKKDTRLISSGADQCLALFTHAGHDGEATVATKLLHRPCPSSRLRCCHLLSFVITPRV